MQTLNIALPNSLEAFGVGESVSPEYWQRIRKEVQTRLDQYQEQDLEQFVREGLESGEPIPFTHDIWTKIDANIQRRLKEAK